MTSEDSAEMATLAQRQLGRFLRRKRDDEGLSREQVAELAEMSPAGVWRLESARQKKVKPQEVQAVCEVLDIDAADIEYLLGLAEQAQIKSWTTVFNGLHRDPKFDMIVGLTEVARSLIQYHEVVPGLLQTREYARAVIGRYFHDHDPDEIDRRVELRLKRQLIITRKAKPVKYEVFLDESALYRAVGRRRVMSAQLRHLIEISKRPNVTVRIYPFSAGIPNGMLIGPFMILDFGVNSKGNQVDPPLVYLESSESINDLFLEGSDDVLLYYDFASVIRGASLDEPHTQELLDRVARRYEREH
ncbi:helix-turn-helix domain-containing protein [Nocardia terpenica]|uniref:helix-turn-helix domain-containing protein n=1 Tax=Nocardia terpenica TaxID=455432 RepID=UPI001892D2A7|nr:helix-turn-helix transcriptional regulator [Nocardia terpenica]MBF6059346.1 helix-turn-helix domain-containing protein [Nocardia terpenica]MBF6103115.1 helix-turn-helix domain-containing protein [Nocardia terpenica]MBF6110696.1 helix-turn-helix domain-containing protein [Nocardia terpenica]MBF6116827.1 helix-turn-helix domain-containing protein [Nocardia terpenica]